MDFLNSSNVEKYIEEKIEHKINNILDILPQNTKNIVSLSPKLFSEYSLYEVYNGVLRTTIDIINEVIALVSKRNYVNQSSYYSELFMIFFKTERRFYIGIIMVIISFILYFLDGTSV